VVILSKARVRGSPDPHQLIVQRYMNILLWPDRLAFQKPSKEDKETRGQYRLYRPLASNFILVQSWMMFFGKFNDTDQVSSLVSEQEQINPTFGSVEHRVHQTETIPTTTISIPVDETFAIDDTSPTESTLTVSHERLTSESALTDNTSNSPVTSYEEFPLPPDHTSSGTMSLFSSKGAAPSLTLPNKGLSRKDSYDSTSTSNTNKPLPKSPNTSKLGSFFGWGGNTSPASSTTTFSEDKNYSPLPSPTSPRKPFPKSLASRIIPSGIDIPRANADESYFEDAFLQATPETPSHVGEMEEELRTISSELATSIRREMELEDLVERLQSEASNPQGPNKRTSDYFSDSGTSSVNKYSGETDARTDELDRLQRKTEREKAQIRLDLTAKVQDERDRRKQLEKQIRRLEEKASQVGHTTYASNAC
jgi:hypothetical protein